MFGWIIFITICVLAIASLSGRFTADCAAQAGRSRRAWFVWGAVFFPLFPLPWMVLCVLPRR